MPIKQISAKINPFKKHNRTRYVAEKIIRNGEYNINKPTRKIYASKSVCVRLAVISGLEETVFEADGVMPFYTRFGTVSEKHIQSSLKTDLMHTNGRISFLYTLFDNILFSTKNIRGEVVDRVGMEYDGIGYVQTNDGDMLFGFYEYKTTGDNIPADPEEKYESQIHVYQSILPLPVFLDYQSRKIRNRGALVHDTMLIKYDYKSVYNKTVDIFKMALYQDAELLPPSLPVTKKQLCKDVYCSFHSLCWGWASSKERITNSFTVLKQPTDNDIKTLNVKAKQLAEEFLSDENYNNRINSYVQYLLNSKDKNYELM